jgi:(p)ppGpp synthase/HD superfamily hydrolase
MTHLARAIEIATEAHDGQTDKTGQPYSEHCLRVADAVHSLDEKIVAWLHDVVEKGKGWSLKQLREAGFSPAIVSAVAALTKRKGEDDRSFVRRAASNPLARAVKRADLDDNRSQAAAAGLPTAKYDQGLAILREEFGEGEKR